MSIAISYKSYSKAFFKSAKFKNSLDTAYNDATLIIEAISLHPKLKYFIKDKYIKSKIKLDLILNIFTDLSNETKHFLSVLARAHRLHYISVILSEFINIYYKEKNITKIKIDIAAKLKEDIINKLESSIKDKIHSKVLTNTSIDNSLIGGFKIYLDSKTYDASIANRLNLLKSQLLEKL